MSAWKDENPRDLVEFFFFFISGRDLECNPKVCFTKNTSNAHVWYRARAKINYPRNVVPKWCLLALNRFYRLSLSLSLSRHT